MRPRLEVTVARDRISAQVKRGRRTVWSGECELPERDGLLDALASLPRRDDFPKQCQEVRFLLEPPFVQLRTLRDLPPVRSGELRRVVEQQSNRFFRSRNSTLIVDAKWQERKKGSAQAGAVDAGLVDLLQDAAVESNMTLVEILAAPNENKRSETLKFVGSDRQNKRLVRKVLGAILVSAWICSCYLAGYLLDLEIDRRRVATEVETLRPELEVLDAARREIADVVTVVGAIEDREQRRGWVTLLLARIANTLPESAHVVSVSGTPDGVTIGLRARDLELVENSLVGGGLAIVGERDAEDAAMDAGGQEWHAATIRLNGGLRAGS